MTILNRGAIFIMALSVLGVVPFATAQEHLDAGKSGVQLFAANCAGCHKLSEGVSKARAVFGLEGFLREHYAASRESAAVLADYLRATGDKRAPVRAQLQKRGADANATREKPRPGKQRPHKSDDKMD